MARREELLGKIEQAQETLTAVVLDIATAEDEGEAGCAVFAGAAAYVYPVASGAVFLFVVMYSIEANRTPEERERFNEYMTEAMGTFPF